MPLLLAGAGLRSSAGAVARKAPAAPPVPSLFSMAGHGHGCTSGNANANNFSSLCQGRMTQLMSRSLQPTPQGSKTTSAYISFSTLSRRAGQLQRPSSRRQRLKLVRWSNAHRRAIDRDRWVGSDEPVNVARMASRMGLRLTKGELGLLHTKLADSNGIITSSKLIVGARKSIQERANYETLLSVIESAHGEWDRLGQRAITTLRFIGTAVFAMVGTEIAGEGGMNIVGCTLVGCASAMGGGTLNNFLYGTSSPLTRRPGAFWCLDVRFLSVSLASCIATFFGWPVYCRYRTNHFLYNVIGEDKLDDEGHVRPKDFVEAFERDDTFRDAIVTALPKLNKSNGSRSWNEITTAAPMEYFNEIDKDNSGTIDWSELQTIVAKGFDNSVVTYAADTIALASLGIFSAHGVIGVGLHPLVACVSGVTVCFGGILRDIFCGRSLAIGCQSYAFANGCGATVYVLLRQAELSSGRHIPLILRIIISFGTIIGIRAWEWNRGEPLLGQMALKENPEQFRVVERKKIARMQTRILSEAKDGGGDDGSEGNGYNGSR